MKLQHVMIDLETVSLRSNAAILSIGAVKFDPFGAIGELGETFYTNVRLQSCIDVGLHVEGHTVMWWLNQDNTARQRLSDPEPIDLGPALGAFFAWFGMTPAPVWGNGAAFDCVVLRNAFIACEGTPPFSYKDEMCYRTIRQQVRPDVTSPPSAELHYALEDAKAQAVHLQKLFNFINRG